MNPNHYLSLNEQAKRLAHLQSTLTVAYHTAKDWQLEPFLTQIEDTMKGITAKLQKIEEGMHQFSMKVMNPAGKLRHWVHGSSLDAEAFEEWTKSYCESGDAFEIFEGMVGVGTEEPKELPVRRGTA